MRRTVAVLAIAMGVALILSTLFLGLFQKTAQAERTLDRFAAGTSTEGFAQFGSDYQTALTGSLQLRDEAFPRLARDLDMSESEFAAFVASDFTALDTAVKAIPSITGFIDPIVGEINELPSSKLRPVYDIPIASLPVTSMAWLSFALGVLLLGVGLAVWFLRDRRAIIAVGAVGAAMALGPIAISLPQNTNEAADIVTLLRVALSEDIVKQSEDAVVIGNNMVGEIRTEFLPTLAQRMELSEDELNTLIDEDYPATAAFLAAWDDTSVRIDQLATNMRASVDDFAEADELPYEAIPWLFIGAGVLLAAVAGAALFVGSRARHPVPAV
jgi:hypothetical protein